MKSLQRSFVRLLNECRIEIENKHPKRNSLSHGFKKDHSILTNARPHVRRRYVLNLDIKDFFPSFNFGRVRGYFIKNKDFGLNEKAATVLAQIACYQNSLPQGSPCSPIISDLLAHIMDVRLANLAKKYGCTYSRYADDLTFSTNQRNFPATLAIPLKKDPRKWKIGTELAAKITNSGFVINPEKTRMQYAASRQTVTGLVVNKKVNIKSGYYRIARSMCRAVFKEGKYKFKSMPNVTDLACLEGQLSHIFHIKFSETERLRVHDRSKKTQRINNDKLVGWLQLYRRFLFYKLFVALDRPTVVCEGVTDSIYIKATVQSLKGKFPSLVTVDGAKTRLNFSFFRYTKYSELLLRLGGGSDKQKNFMATYPEELKYFEHAPMKHPVIVLIDNDKGASEIFNLMNSKFKSEVNLETKLPFYPICDNLFLVKTPEIGKGGISKIEDFFAQELLDVKLNGKVFSSASKIDPSKEYSKTAFAERVVIPNKSKIDFAKFVPLLERIAAVIAFYKPPK